MTNEEFIESIRLEGEEWRPVVGFEHGYMVSSFGRFMSIGKEQKCRNGHFGYKPPKIIKGTVHFGYAIFNIRKNGKYHGMRLGRMVAMAFIPNPNNYPDVDHIDTNRLNDRVDNLRWCTRKMNMNNPITRARLDKIADELRGKPNLHLSKKVVQLDMNGNLIRIYPSATSCTSYGFTLSAVCHVCNGERPRHKGYKFMFLSDYELLINKSKNPNGSEIKLSLPF